MGVQISRAVGFMQQVAGTHVGQDGLVAVDGRQVDVRWVGGLPVECTQVGVHLEALAAAHAHDGLHALRPQHVPLEVVEDLVVVQGRVEGGVLVQAAARRSGQVAQGGNVHVALRVCEGKGGVRAVSSMRDQVQAWRLTAPLPRIPVPLARCPH